VNAVGRSAVASELRSWFPYHVDHPGAEVSLFCFPFAGGSASFYRAWHTGLPPWIEVWAVQPPGRETRYAEPPLTSLADYVSTALRLVTSVTGDRPYAFFGHSLGALVAYEMTLRLGASAWRSPERLFLSAVNTPGRWPDDVRAWLAPHGLDDLLSAGGRLPAKVLSSLALVAAVTGLTRADLAICSDYRPSENATTVPITAPGGADDATVPLPGLADWADRTTSGCEVLAFEGGHFYLADRMDEVGFVVSDRLEKDRGV
jgi:surfactin synthase thioesterase subunit